METELTEAQFEMFKHYVRKTAGILGLRDWDIVVEKSMDRSGDEQARCFINVVGKSATITLNMWNVDDTSDANVVRSAVHEVLHVLLAEMTWPLRDHIKSADNAAELLNRQESAEHGVINRLSYLLLDAPIASLVDTPSAPMELVCEESTHSC